MRWKRRTRAVAFGLLVLTVTAGCRIDPNASGWTPGGASSPGGPGAPVTGAPGNGTAPAGRTAAGTDPGAATPPRERQDAADSVVLAPGSRGVRVRELQARLVELRILDRSPTGYFGSVTTEAVISFQRQQGLPRTGAAGPATWRTLRTLTQQPTLGQLYPTTTRPISTPDARCLVGRVLCISKRSDTLAWMIDGQVVSSMDVRFGSQYAPTREGTFTVFRKSRHHVSTIYHTPMPYAMFFSGGQAVHYSTDFAARGYRGASHGCVNVRDKSKIAALFAAVRPGDKVVIYK
ncbi:L,D-transpeptidase family protein [Streptomyces sp. NPDC003077]|uniref:L,D-transpeptidase family protein n=1 Tax=Streptomyces sp. NPDC003077 TaxID=3154443 RepID=UPI0033B07076